MQKDLSHCYILSTITHQVMLEQGLRSDFSTAALAELRRIQGMLEDSKVCQAQVQNHAKLAYYSIAAWLEKKGAIPEVIVAANGLGENLHLLDQVAKRLKTFWYVTSICFTVLNLQYWFDEYVCRNAPV